ncbi:MAG: GNAT family N-acetyltransferase [Clostridia bacterium]|nr:GNAT family N-acetyltransferase [Clostridia bacterium]
MDYVIRPSEPRDAEGLAAIRRMPGVFETTLGLPSCRTVESVEFIEDMGPNEHHFVAVTETEAGELVIGAIGLTVRMNPRTRHVGSLGIFVHKDYQNAGVGTALMRTVLDLADNWLMLVRVELEVYADNERARHLYEKMGFEVEGLRRKAVVRGGRYIDEYMMSRIRHAGDGV